jgi:hypothetical protein
MDGMMGQFRRLVLGQKSPNMCAPSNPTVETACSEESVPPNKDWDRLYNFQRQDRTKEHVTVRELLDMLGIPYSMRQHLYSNAFYPSSKEGTLGHDLRSALLKLEEQVSESGQDDRKTNASVQNVFQLMQELNSESILRLGVIMMSLDASSDPHVVTLVGRELNQDVSNFWDSISAEYPQLANATLRFQETEALAFKLLSSHQPLKSSWRVAGTGTAMKWNGQVFGVTAAHVLNI